MASRQVRARALRTIDGADAPRDEMDHALLGKRALGLHHNREAFISNAFARKGAPSEQQALIRSGFKRRRLGPTSGRPVRARRRTMSHHRMSRPSTSICAFASLSICSGLERGPFLGVAPFFAGGNRDGAAAFFFGGIFFVLVPLKGCKKFPVF